MGPFVLLRPGPPKHWVIQLRSNPHEAYPPSEVSVFLAHQSLLVDSPVSTLVHTLWTLVSSLSCTGFTDSLALTSLLSCGLRGHNSIAFFLLGGVFLLGPAHGGGHNEKYLHLFFWTPQPTVLPMLAHTGSVDRNWPFTHVTHVPLRWEGLT